MKYTISKAPGAGMRGARVTGVTKSTLNNQAVYSQLNELLAAHGVIVFDGVRVVEDLPFKILNVFSPRKEHPTEPTSQSDQGRPTDLLPIKTEIDKRTFEIEGRSPIGSRLQHVDKTDFGKQRAGAVGSLGIVDGEGVVAFRDATLRHCHTVEAIQPAKEISDEGTGALRCARNLAQIERDLIAAEKAYAHAEERRHQAQRDRDVALVAINQHQAEIDGAVARLRERSSRMSSWQGNAGNLDGVLMLDKEA